MADFHQQVVDDYRKVVAGRPVGLHNHKVANQGHIEGNFPAHQVVESQRATLFGDVESQGRFTLRAVIGRFFCQFFPVFGIPAGAAVDVGAFFRLGFLTLCIQFGLGMVAVVGMTGINQLIRPLSV
jgi:hypothetical protein